MTTETSRQSDYLKLAGAAMERFGVSDMNPVLIGHTEHVAFRLEPKDGREKLFLRLHTLPWGSIAPAEWLAEDHIESELLWLEAIAQDTDIIAPRPRARSERGPCLPGVERHTSGRRLLAAQLG